MHRREKRARPPYKCGCQKAVRWVVRESLSPTARGVPDRHEYHRNEASTEEHGAQGMVWNNPKRNTAECRQGKFEGVCDEQERRSSLMNEVVKQA